MRLKRKTSLICAVFAAPDGRNDAPQRENERQMNDWFAPRSTADRQPWRIPNGHNGRIEQRPDMFHSTSRFKPVLRGLVAAALVGTAALTAAPAQAQPSFNFQIEIPGQGGGSAQFGFGTGPNQPGSGFGGPGFGGPGFGPGHGGWHDRRPGHHMRCLTDREIRRGLQNYGFFNLAIVRELPRNRVTVEGAQGNWVYSMRVDRCTGEVDRVERLYRTGRGGWGWGNR